MAWVGSVLGIVSSVAGTAGGVADGQASAAQRAFGAKAARENARLAGDQSAMQEAALRRDNAQLLGAQRAAIAESGTGAGGSNGLIAAQDAALAELDALTARYEGRLKMTEYDNQATLLGADSTSGLQRLFGKRGLGRLSHYNWGNPSMWGAPGSNDGRGW
ncbi:MAG TPA: hypothetical protein VEA44_08095 [Caulobacter sp.]|nr:hypothetical protein [Caulobacter sp.]